MMGEESKFYEQRAVKNNDLIPELQLIFINNKKGLDSGRYNTQRCNKVAAIFNCTADGEIPDSYVSIRNRNTKVLKYVNTMDPNVEPWLCPLYYPYGTQGWHDNMIKTGTNRRITRLNYTRYRIAIRDDFNPVILGRRLFQQYLVDSYVKIERDRINYCKFNQEKLRRDSYCNDYAHISRVVASRAWPKILIALGRANCERRMSRRFLVNGRRELALFHSGPSAKQQPSPPAPSLPDIDVTFVPI